MTLSTTKTKAYSKTEAYKELVKECQMNKSLYKGYSKHRSTITNEAIVWSYIKNNKQC